MQIQLPDTCQSYTAARLTYSFVMLLQLGESSLQEVQAMVQQEAGILLDRQRITIEGILNLLYRCLCLSGCSNTKHWWCSQPNTCILTGMFM